MADINAALDPAAVAPKGGLPPRAAMSRGWSRHWPTVVTIGVVVVIICGVLLTTRSADRQTATDANDQLTSIPATEGRHLTTTLVEVVGTSADVYRNGAKVGVTPYPVVGYVGEQVVLTLRRQGFSDLPVTVDISERGTYMETLKAEK